MVIKRKTVSVQSHTQVVLVYLQQFGAIHYSNVRRSLKSRKIH